MTQPAADTLIILTLYIHVTRDDNLSSLSSPTKLTRDTPLIAFFLHAEIFRKKF